MCLQEVHLGVTNAHRIRTGAHTQKSRCALRNVSYYTAGLTILLYLKFLLYYLRALGSTCGKFTVLKITLMFQRSSVAGAE